MPFTDADIIKYFEDSADEVIKANLEGPEDEPDAFEDLRNGFVHIALAYCKKMRTALGKKVTSASGTSTSASSGGKSRAGKPYATFVKMMGAIKRGEMEEEFLDYQVTPGHNYDNKKSKSAERYNGFVADKDKPLEVDGTEQSLHDLHKTLSEFPGMGNTVTLAGVMWGLLPPDVRTDLTSKYLEIHPPPATA